jgi:NADH-quinone oxidoreductase subunit N
MHFVAPDLTPAMPEIFLIGMICLILLVDVFLPDRLRRITHWLSLAALVGAAWLTATLGAHGRLLTFDGMFVNDAMAVTLKLFSYLVVALVFLYSRAYLVERKLFKGEFYVLSLFGLLGMMILISAHNFLTIYLGLELLSLAQYALVALDRDSPAASEAAIKYFVLGAIASGILLYGLSILYGLTRTLDIGQVAASIGHHGANLGAVFALAFVVVALAFKLGAVPFHMWLPDVYEGSPTPVTLYVGSAPKLAAFALFMRLLAEGLVNLTGDWRDMLIALSVLSMAVGSIVAISQTNIKRMLGYSTISHVGFILLGILAGTRTGYQAAMFYTIVYVLMATAAFGMVILLSRRGFEAERLDDFKGLNERSPWFAGMMLFVMFGMTGVPPLVGFYAKLAVLRAVLDVGLVWLAIVAVIFSMISAFYYLRVVKLMYFDKPEDRTPLAADIDMKWILSGNGLALLGLGIFPGSLMALCVRAIGF